MKLYLHKGEEVSASPPKRFLLNSILFVVLTVSAVSAAEITIFDCPPNTPVSIEIYLEEKDEVSDTVKVMPVCRTVTAEFNDITSGRYRVYVFSDTDHNSRLVGKENVILHRESGGIVYAELFKNSTLYISFKNGVLKTGVFRFIVKDVTTVRGNLCIALFRIVDDVPEQTPFRIMSFPVNKKNITCDIPDVPYGEYAVSIFHDIDETNDHKPQPPQRDSSEKHGVLSSEAEMKYMNTFFILNKELFSCEVSLKYGFSRTASLEVEIKELKNAKGQILMNIFSSKEGFPSNKEKAFTYKTEKLLSKKITIRFDNIPFGTYAVSAVHDEDLNSKLNTSLFGVPREGYGVSNDAKGKFAPPAFEDAAFIIDRDEVVITITIGY